MRSTDFRLREHDQTGEQSLDYHRVRSELETDEVEVAVDSVTDAMDLLQLLGHDIECVVDKERMEYTNGEVLITIDQIKGLGNFVEMEMDGPLSDAKEQAFADLIERLDLEDTNRVTHKGYPELILQQTQ